MGGRGRKTAGGAGGTGGAGSKALLVVDVQRDFCEGGNLAVTGGAAVAAAITAHIAASEAAYEAVVATRDAHIDPGDHFSDDPDFAASWPRHCVVDTDGLQFHPGLDAGQMDEVFDKGNYAAAYSGFEASSPDGEPLADWLRDRGVGEVEIVGIATDHCVRATALDAVAAGFRTRVLLPLTAGVAAPTTASALDQMAAAGVELVGTPHSPATT